MQDNLWESREGGPVWSFENLIEVAMTPHLTEAERFLNLRDDLILKKHVRISEDFTMRRYIRVAFLPWLIAKVETSINLAVSS